MTASERSFIGIALQTAKGAINVTDASFQYFLFTDGGMGPQNVVVPLDQEVGGGAMLRSVIKAGVVSAGAFTIIPRPSSLGWFLYGALGDPTDSGTAPSYTHLFKMAADQFAAPYFTLRSTPGGIWGETFQDCRVAALGLNWKASDYIRGSVAFIGGTPVDKVTMTTWAPATYLDKGPQLLAPLTTIEVPTATAVKVLSGSIAMGMNIPMADQWITGSYVPDDFDINSRMFTVTLAVKVIDVALYDKMNYDPAAGAAWAAQMYKEADIKLLFTSDTLTGPASGVYQSLQIKGNGCNAASGNANVIWSCTPIALRAGRQVVMNMTGTFVASPDADPPVTATLINPTASY